ncbi:chorismate mutase [Streptomyces sp. bgisy130]|uniref:chorismate mutase n=1 Tax=Streptomyces sp. bgisy130 TaxID=3413788 RepID=UPI003F4A5175
MQLTPSIRSALAAGAAVAVLFAGAGAAAAAPFGPAAAPSAQPTAPPAPATAPPAQPTAPAAAHSPYAQLRPLATFSAERLATADLVAAAKWGTDSPIDDPAREQEVLKSVADQARQLGADPAATTRIFRDQIEANKVVQRGLFRQWEANPAQVPTERPDLQEVRKEINRVNGELVRAIAASPRARSAPSCTPLLTTAAARVSAERKLDGLHAVALARSLRSVCTGA